MASLLTSDKKAHAVFIPVPAQGHITPMLKLAKILYYRYNFHVTFVHTEYNYRRYIRSRGADALKGLPDFCFETIPDGLPPVSDDDIDVTQDIPSLADSTTKFCLAPFRKLLEKLNSVENAPRVSCIVSDGCMSFTLDAAEEIGIPEVVFWTPSACAFLSYSYYAHLVEKGLVPLKEESWLTNGYLDQEVDWIPGIKNFRLKDFPNFIRTTDRSDIMVNFMIRESQRSRRASAIVLNTFDKFEHDVLNSLSAMYPPIYSIGPLNLLLNQIPESGLDSIESNLWREETGCLHWLSSKPRSSVVYVNFGSIMVLTPQQMTELAWGLANSNQTFLWVIRPDLLRGDRAILSHEFVEETKDRAFFTSWCQQEEVLNHPSVGGFLTHSGWNSTLESISAGVPMICFPFFADQQTNCRFACTEWGIGMEIDSNVKRGEVESLVKDLMEGEKGDEMRNKAKEWKKHAEDATSPNGSSYVNLDKLVKEVLMA